MPGKHLARSLAGDNSLNEANPAAFHTSKTMKAAGPQRLLCLCSFTKAVRARLGSCVPSDLEAHAPLLREAARALVPVCSQAVYNATEAAPAHYCCGTQAPRGCRGAG